MSLTDVIVTTDKKTCSTEYESRVMSPPDVKLSRHVTFNQKLTFDLMINV